MDMPETEKQNSGGCSRLARNRQQERGTRSDLWPKQVAQLSQRKRAAWWVSYGQDWNWETIFTDNIGLYSTTAT